METDPPLIALTGATGFIGSWIARHLVESGWRVRVLVRPGSEKRLPSVPLEPCFGSLEDPQSLECLVTGAHAIVHCAGRVRGVVQSDFDAVNATGTLRLTQLAASHEITRFILISSLAAREPNLSPYALSKRRGEESLTRYPDHPSWVIFRPPAVYGPGDREMMPLLKAMAWGVAPVIGDRNARFSLLYVEDLARAVLAALSGAGVSQRLFELDDGYRGGYSWTDVIDIASCYRGKRVIPIPVPESLLRGVARLSLVSSRLTRKTPMLTPAKVNELRHPDWVCDNTHICRVLNWQPKISFEAGLRMTLANANEHPEVQ